MSFWDGRGLSRSVGRPLWHTPRLWSQSPGVYGMRQYSEKFHYHLGNFGFLMTAEQGDNMFGSVPLSMDALTVQQF